MYIQTSHEITTAVNLITLNIFQTKGTVKGPHNDIQHKNENKNTGIASMFANQSKKSEVIRFANVV